MKVFLTENLLTMKKIFVLLLSIWIPIYLLMALLASCEKSNLSESPAINKATDPETETAKNPVAGKWQLAEYFQDIGNGVGSWTSAKAPEQISFTSSGNFSSNQYFSLYNQQFNKYRIIDSTHIELFSTQNEQSLKFYFRREDSTSLLFHPLCKENCSRRYKLIN